jgi:hypothetical protein
MSERLPRGYSPGRVECKTTVQKVYEMQEDIRLLLPKSRRIAAWEQSRTQVARRLGNVHLPNDVL